MDSQSRAPFYADQPVRTESQRLLNFKPLRGAASSGARAPARSSIPINAFWSIGRTVAACSRAGQKSRFQSTANNRGFPGYLRSQLVQVGLGGLLLCSLS